MPRRPKQIIAVHILVASHFLSFFVLLSVLLKVIKILARSFISLFLGQTKMSKIKVTDPEIMTLCFNIGLLITARKNVAYFFAIRSTRLSHSSILYPLKTSENVGVSMSNNIECRLEMS